MSATVTKGQKFKAAFGVVSSNAKTARKNEVLTVLGDLTTEITNLPITTPAKAVAHVTDVVSKLRDRLASYTYDTLKNNAAYKLCDAVEKDAKKAAKAIAALAESEKELPKLKGMMDRGESDELDKMVQKIGARAKTIEEQGFLIAAIRARYGIDSMSGELTSGALPRFYKVLGMVPEEHALLNQKLTGITRTKQTGTSDYGGGSININGGAGTPNRSNREKYDNSEGKKLDLPNFDSTTLHEIGHAVDEASGFMDGKMGNASFGGWEKSSRKEVVDILIDKLKVNWEDDLGLAKIKVIAEAASMGDVATMVNTLDMQKDVTASMTPDDLKDDPGVKEMDRLVSEFLDTLHTDPSVDDLNRFLATHNQALAQSKVTETDPMKRMLITSVIQTMREGLRRADDVIDEKQTQLKLLTDGKPDPTDLTKIKDDPAIAWAKLIRTELWWKSSTEIEGTAAVGDTVYQADGTKWWKYKKAARAQMVRDYQFRSPAEWFAEVYAVFMLGKLAPSHPAYGLIKGIDTSKREGI